MTRQLPILWLGILLCACSRGSSTATLNHMAQTTRGQVRYTLVNMHLNDRGQATSVNHVDHALLPICTPVEIQSVTRRRVQFIANGTVHMFLLHRSTILDEETHMRRLFGRTCPNVEELPAADQTGIQEGRVVVGMSKAGVLLALGYPPERATPTLDQAVWQYWRDEGSNFRVHFSGNIVSALDDPDGGMTARGGPDAQPAGDPLERRIPLPAGTTAAFALRVIAIAGLVEESANPDAGIAQTTLDDSGIGANDVAGRDATVHRRYVFISSPGELRIRLTLRACTTPQARILGLNTVVEPQACQPYELPANRGLRGRVRRALVEPLDDIAETAQREAAMLGPATQPAADIQTI